jgi:hypothetical protein
VSTTKIHPLISFQSPDRSSHSHQLASAMATVTPDVSRGPVLLSLSSVTASLALSTTVVRFYLRRRSGSRIGADDYAAALASVSPAALLLTGYVLLTVVCMARSWP